MNSKEAVLELICEAKSVNRDDGRVCFLRKIIEKDLDLEIYFADLHAPWQRGSNENINGLLRFFFPRGTDFRKVTRVQLDAVLDKINNRPRKCLDILSPIDYFNQSVALGLTI